MTRRLRVPPSEEVASWEGRLGEVEWAPRDRCWPLVGLVWFASAVLVGAGLAVLVHLAIGVLT